MSRYKDAKTPTEKRLRNPVGSKRGRREGRPSVPLLGHAGPCARSPRRPARGTSRSLLLGGGGSGDKRGA